MSAPARVLPIVVAGIALAPIPASAVQSALWLDPTSGLWTDPARWSTAPFYPDNGSPLPEDRYDATIAAAGAAYTIALNTDIGLESFQLDSPDATVVHEAGILDIAGTATLSSGTYLLDGGTLRGGTWLLQGGALAFANDINNILDGAQVVGDLDLTRFSADVRLRGGANFTGTARIGNGSTLWIDDDLRLDGNTIDFTLPGSCCSTRGVAIAEGATLTLGPATRVDLVADNSNLSGDGTLINEGTIRAASRFSVFDIRPGHFINRGLVEADASLNLYVGTFSDDRWTNEASGIIQAVGDARIAFRGQGLNLGTLRAVDGARLDVGGAWDNDGVVELVDGELEINGRVSTADLGTIVSSGNSVITIGSEIQDGVLDNTGRTIEITAAGPRYRLDGGSIVGGTIVATERPIQFGSTTRSLLDSVTVEGDLDLAAARSQGALVGGATFTGTATLGDRARLGFHQTGELDGVVVSLAAGGNSTFGVGGDHTLTIGPATTILLAATQTALGSDVLLPGDGTVVNRGSIVTGVSGSFSTQRIDPDAFVNEGSVGQVANAPGSLTIGKTGGSWTNAATGTIAMTGRTLAFVGNGSNLGHISTAGSTLTIGGGSWQNLGTIEAANALILLDGQYSTAGIGTIQSSGSTTTSLGGVLDNAGSVLDLAELPLATIAGTVVGGAVTHGGGQPIAAGSGALFEGALLDGDLQVTASGYATLRNGARITGSSSVGLNGTLRFDDTATLGPGPIDLAQGADLLAVGPHTLTLGPDTEVSLLGTAATVGSDPSVAGGAIVNQGTIRAINAGFDRAISAEQFRNEGLVHAQNQSELTIGRAGFAWTNEASGVVRADGAAITFKGDWQNLGTIELTSSTLRLGDVAIADDRFTIEDVGHIVRDTASNIVVDAELDNRDRILDLAASVGSLILNRGSIVGGSILQTADARLRFGGGPTLATPAVLDGVRVEGGLDLSRGGIVRLVNGASWTGLAQLGVATSGGGGHLAFAETREIEGVAIQLLGNSFVSSMPRFGVSGTNTLTLEADVDVSLDRSSALTSDVGVSGTGTIVNRGTITVGALSTNLGGNSNIDPDVFVNEGLIDALRSLGTLEIGDPGKSWTNAATGRIQTVSHNVRFDGTGVNAGGIAAENATIAMNGSWSNQGTIELDGATLELFGTFTPDRIGTVVRSGRSQVVLKGVLDNSGSGLFGATDFGSLTLNRGTIRGGLVQQVGDERLVFTSTSNVLDGTRVDGGLDLSAPGAALSLVNGAAFTGTAELGSGAALSGLAGNLDDVVFNLRGGSITNLERLDFTDAVLGAGSEIAFLGDRGVARGTSLVSQGRITVRGEPIFLSTIDFDGFENRGLVTLEGGRLSLDCGVCPNFDPATGVLTGGSWSVGPGSHLQLKSGFPEVSIRINQADLTLSGSTSRFDSLNSLEVNGAGGTLRLLDGRGFAAPNGFQNLGQMEVVGGTFQSPTLTNATGARLQMAGTILGTLANHGTLAIAGEGLGALDVMNDLLLGDPSSLQIQIGAGSDHVSIGGNLDLAGVLAISFLPELGAIPDASQAFELASVVGAISGTFANVVSGGRLAVAGGGGSFEIRYGEGEYLNRIVALNFVPEPESGLLVALGLLAFAAAGRRRRS